MDHIDNYIKFNEKVWDNFSDANYQWTIPISSEAIDLAKQGVWNVVITPTKPVPRSWFPKDFSNMKILCLAGGGGQQGPIFAALGAEVTVFDNCKKQLEKDELF